MTSIGDDAFYGCSRLISIVWNAKKYNDISSALKAPFDDICSQITSFTFGESVQHIPAYLCYGMSKLTSVTIPNSVTTIGEYAFKECTGLTSVVWNAKNCADFTLTSAPFYDIRSKITSFTFGESVQHIPAYLCYGMSKLTSVTIPNSVTTIGEYAFKECTGLTSITIPNNVIYIGSSAFYNCCSLASIESLAEVPPTLGDKVYDYVSMKIPVYVPCGSVSAYKSAKGWKAFTNIQEPSAEHSYSIVINVNDNKMGTAQVDKNNFCGAQISATPNYGYHFVKWSDGNTDNPRILELTQDATFTAEFAQTYSGQCGDNLYWSFNNNTLTITGSGDMWDERPWGLFDEETKTISFPNGITHIGSSAFSGFINLASITIPNSVTSIGDYAFQGCSGLTSITIPNSMTGIGKSVFDDCSRLTSIVWNAKNCEDYSYHPFKNIRSQITSFTIGDNVQYVPTYLCEGMSKLTSITIPSSVTSIGSRAFQLCSGLTSVTIGNSVTRIEDDAFLKCSSLTSITIGNSVATIGEGAFESCSSLTSITIPNSVTNIKYGAFADCVSLSKVSLGSSISYIGGEVFAGCNCLYDIYCYATTPPEAKESSFANYNVNLYVPCESKEDYEYDSFWGKFKFIECIDVESAVDDIPTAITNVQKIFRDDQLLIIRDGKSYNVIGQEIGN